MSLFGSTFLAIFALIAISLDLGLFNRRVRALSLAEALAWSTFWLALSLFFTALVHVIYERDLELAAGPLVLESNGQPAALQFFTTYVIERAISVANVLVVVMIFNALEIPLMRQKRTLFWGLLSIIMLRAAMLAVGAALISRWHWAVYLFGVLLLASAARVFVARREKVVPDRNIAVLLLRLRVPEAPRDASETFLPRVDGRRGFTPWLVVLLLILTANVMFAIDAVPGTFAITRDPFLIVTANLFSLLGLRAMYFAVAPFADRLRYLQLSLVAVLVYVAVKVFVGAPLPEAEPASLAAIGAMLGAGALLSMILGPREAPGISPMLRDVEEIVWISYRQARRLAVFLIGLTVMLAGVVMIVTPGPAFIVIPLGLAILAIEFTWARRWLLRLSDRFGQVESIVSARVRGITRPPTSQPTPHAPERREKENDDE